MKTVSRILLTAIMLCNIIFQQGSWIAELSTTYAGLVINDNDGYATIDFNGNMAGVVTQSNINHYPIIGTIGSTSGSGHVLLSHIEPASISARKDITITHTGPAPDVSILSCDGNTIIPRTTYTGAIDTSTIDTATTPCLQTALWITSPLTFIDQVDLTRSAQAVTLLELNGPATITAGSCAQYRAQWSHSHTTNSNTLLVMSLPHYTGSTGSGYDLSTINTGYNQYPASNLAITSISSGGVIYTGSTPITVDGHTIQPHSVYWTHDNITPGTTSSNAIALCSDTGTQNGVTYTVSADLLVDTDTLTQSTSTTIESTPSITAICTPQTQTYLQGLTTEIATINMRIMHDNTSNEDAFNTDVTVDYAPVLTALQNTCGRSETEAIGRITVGTGFSAISGTVSTLSLDALYATNTPNHPAQTPHNITTTTSIDMTDCGDAIALANAIQYTISADNITTQTNSCAPITYVPKRNDDISIGDFVWDDLNRDGRQNAGEPGLAGVAVQLLWCSDDTTVDGTVIATGATSATGTYLFENLTAGSYRLAIPTLTDAMIASGYVFTSRTEGTIDGSDMDGSTRQTQCITTTPQTDNHALDVGFYIPATPEAPVDNGNGNDNTNSGSGGTVTPPSDYRYNKCLYTTTTDESTNTYANTNHESIHPTDSGHYNNDCNNTDPSYTKTYGQTTHDERSTAIEMNAQGETFFHLNLHGSEDVVKHNIALYDRIPDSLTISGVSIYTTTSGSMTQADTTPRAAVYCHSSSTMPSIDHSILTGVALPDASAIGTGWSSTCDSNSRHVLAYAPCINTDTTSAMSGSLCAGAPSDIQYRIAVTPSTTTSVNQCDATTPNTIASDTNTAYLHFGAVSNGSDDSITPVTNAFTQGTLPYHGRKSQSYTIYNTPLSQQATLATDLIGPTQLLVGESGTYTFDRQTGISDTSAYTGTAQIQLQAHDGQCPTLTDLTGAVAGWSYDTTSCMLSGPLNQEGGTPTAVHTTTPLTKYENTYDANGNEISQTSYTYSNGEWKVIDRRERIYNANGWATSRISYYNYIDGKPEEGSRKELTYDANGDIASSTHYNYSNGQRVGYKKNEYTLNEDRKRTSHTSYIYSNGERAKYYKSEYAYDTNGNETLSVRYRYLNGQWIKNTKYEYTYDVDGKKTGEKIYTWRNGQWVGNNKYEYTYDTNGNETLYISYNYSNGEWIGDYKREETYDASGNRTSYATYSYLNGQWVGNNKHEYTYDTNGNATLRTDYNYSNGEWTKQREWEKTYDTNGNETSRIHYRYSNGQQIKTHEYKSTYDENGKQTSYTRSDYTSEGTLTGGNKREKTYDTNGNETSYIDYDVSNGQWTKSSKREYTYSDGKKTGEKIYTWRNGQWERENHLYAEYTYDANGNIIKTIEKNSSWTHRRSKHEYTYDANGNQTSQANYRYSNGQWVGNNKYEYTYDANGKRTSHTYYNYSNGEWTGFQKYEYTYDANRNKTSEIKYNITNTTHTSQGAVYYTLSYPSLTTETTVEHRVDTSLTTTCSSMTGQDTVQTRYTLPPSPIETIEVEIPYIPTAASSLPIEDTRRALVTSDKFLDQTVIESDGTITYTIQSLNQGDIQSQNTYIIDALPRGTELVSVITSGTIDRVVVDSDQDTAPLGSQIYDCTSCRVYYATGTLSPDRPSITQPYDRSTISSQFALGVDDGDGTWSAPDTMTDPRYVAVEVVSSGATAHFAPSEGYRVGIQVQNRDRTVGSIISNTVMTIGDDTLPAIANTVHTTIIEQVINTLAGVIYHDIDASQTYTDADEPVDNILVRLYDADGTEIATTRTRADGVYIFDGLPNGRYSVSYDSADAQASDIHGLQPLYESVANIGIINDTTTGSTPDTHTIADIDLYDSVAGTLYAFGMAGRPSSITGTIRQEIDQATGLGSDDERLQNVIVSLYNQSGSIVTTTRTDANGVYSFADVWSGSYTVSYQAPDDLVASTAIAGHIASDGRSSSTTQDATTMRVTLGRGESSIANDFVTKTTPKNPDPETPETPDSPTPPVTVTGPSTTPKTPKTPKTPTPPDSPTLPTPTHPAPPENPEVPTPPTPPTLPTPPDSQEKANRVQQYQDDFALIKIPDHIPLTGTKANQQIQKQKNKKGLKLLTGRGIYNTILPRQAVYEPNDKKSFAEMYALLPSEYHNASSYFVGYGSIIPITTDTQNMHDAQITSLLNQGLVLAPESEGLHDIGLDVIYGHSSSTKPGPFSASLVPTILFGEKDTTFSLYVRQTDGTYREKAYQIETILHDVDPKNTDLLEPYNAVGKEYVALGSCQAGETIGSGSKRIIHIAKRIQPDNPYGPILDIVYSDQSLSSVQAQLNLALYRLDDDALTELLQKVDTMLHTDTSLDQTQQSILKYIQYNGSYILIHNTLPTY